MHKSNKILDYIEEARKWDPNFKSHNSKHPCKDLEIMPTMGNSSLSVWICIGVFGLWYPRLDNKEWVASIRRIWCNAFSIQESTIKVCRLLWMLFLIGPLELISVWFSEDQRKNITKTHAQKEIGLHLHIILTTPPLILNTIGRMCVSSPQR